VTPGDVRKPAHAGTFYPADPHELIKAIEASFLHPIGPGRLPVEREVAPREAIGYVVPHAGYIYSGPVAAHAYYDLARQVKPRAVVIVGPNHHGIGHPAAVYRGRAWETPLGLAPVDNEIGEFIVANTRFFAFDNEAHVYEHSLEVQVPFLQYIYGDVPIVPIAVYLQSLEVARDLAVALAKLVEAGEDIVVLASTDFNHYEPHDVTVEKDLKAIDRILALDDEGLYRVLEEYNITMCGPVAAATLINTAKLLGAGKPVLLQHATSGDVVGDKSYTVGYASIKFPL